MEKRSRREVIANTFPTNNLNSGPPKLKLLQKRVSFLSIPKRQRFLIKQKQKTVFKSPIFWKLKTEAKRLGLLLEIKVFQSTDYWTMWCR